MVIDENRAIAASACVLYLIGAITDYFDGMIARKYQIITAEGKFVDPLADKMLTSAAFIAFVQLDIVALWMILIIIIRDFGTTFLRIWAKKIDIRINTSLLAKWKTFIQMIFIAYILTFVFLKNTELISPQIADKIIYSDVTYISMLLLTLFTIWTAIEYVLANKEHFGLVKKKHNKKNVKENVSGVNNIKKILFCKITGSFLGIGFIPFAPGTIATFIAVGIYLLIPDLYKTQIALILASLFFFISIPIITVLEKTDTPDPRYFVLDEMVGIWFALSNPYFNPEILWLVILILLFRLFDIFKPYPINLLNSKKGAFFVLADDIVAGFLASMIYQIIYTLYNLLGIYNYLN